ncbi:hypothetical protein BAUCODRAFT_125219 [Baudoinia panamericana UAMH 10762]|uniref:Uncharacterized protein n=1 Tax=Baudoinia panamericana (strain UAMH 10762) TaxID=717646 RepID=M2N3P6_BAUPA|nr:uncharacterized protein BAUCODRAFT_125219 [Baudoinia panamericana UAMH 10762]EMC93345.1 hypothetical protein BAUCODRAFT_125219 [Baudoinia panamericana UAMH 10762]
MTDKVPVGRRLQYMVPASGSPSRLHASASVPAAVGRNLPLWDAASTARRSY